jgi:hypothetical protein
LIGRWRGAKRIEPRLRLVERIALGPRQSLALVETEGQRMLVATSAEGGPAFYALGNAREGESGGRIALRKPVRAARRDNPRISW